MRIGDTASVYKPAFTDPSTGVVFPEYKDPNSADVNCPAGMRMSPDDSQCLPYTDPAFAEVASSRIVDWSEIQSSPWLWVALAVVGLVVLKKVQK